MHKYTNEDVSFGSWLIGLDVEHVDERSLCCGTPPGLILLLYSSFSILLQQIALFYVDNNCLLIRTMLNLEVICFTVLSG